MTPDDPALTAFALGELSPSESSAIAGALKDNDSLHQEYLAISAMAGFLSETLGREPLSLGAERIAEIHKAGQRPDSNVLVMEHRKKSRRQSILAVAGVAVVVVSGFVALSRLNVDQSLVQGTSGEGEFGAIESAGNSDQLPGQIIPSATSSGRLPLQIAVGDPSFVERALHTTGDLPARDQFQIADWVNIGRIKATPQLKVGNVAVYTEIGPCSWSPDRSLLLVNLRPLDGKKTSVLAELSFDLERVKAAKLLGGSGKNKDAATLPESLQASQTLLYELELIDEGEGIGVLNIETLEGETGYLPLADDPSLEGDVTREFAVSRVLGGFARWAASEARDTETLVALALKTRDLIEMVSDEPTRYALDMILQSEEILAARTTE